MKSKKFNLNKIAKRLKKPWTPKVIGKVGYFVIRIAKFDGKYHWHKHKNEDELFIVFQGKIKIMTEFGNVTLNNGEGIKIPKNVKHCSVAIKPSIVLMFESLKLKK